jgi:hypothetical protein
MRLGDLIASGHRTAQAIAAALAMALVVVVLLVMKCQNAADPFLGTDQEYGTLVKVVEQIGEPAMKGQDERRGYLGVVLLTDSTQVEVLLPKPPPQVGDRVPLRCERYASGKRIYSFDRQGLLVPPLPSEL